MQTDTWVVVLPPAYELVPVGLTGAIAGIYTIYGAQPRFPGSQGVGVGLGVGVGVALGVGVGVGGFGIVMHACVDPSR